MGNQIGKSLEACAAKVVSTYYRSKPPGTDEYLPRAMELLRQSVSAYYCMYGQTTCSWQGVCECGLDKGLTSQE